LARRDALVEGAARFFWYAAVFVPMFYDTRPDTKEPTADRRAKFGMINRYSGLTAAVLMAISLAGAPGANADDEPSQRERAEEFARQGMERLMQALDLLMESIPQYELPFVDENGDIIIRRRRGADPKNPPPKSSAPEVDSTDT